MDPTLPTTTDVAPVPPPTLSSFLALVNDGALAADAAEQIQKLIMAMQHTAMTVGGIPKGALVLSLALKLDGGLFEVRGEVSVKLPKIPRGRSMFYALKDGRWSANNPKQGELPLEAPRDVSTAPPVRSMRAI